MADKGYIYIMTNPSFKEYVKAAPGRVESQLSGAVCVPRLCYIRGRFCTFRQKATLHLGQAQSGSPFYGRG